MGFKHWLLLYFLAGFAFFLLLSEWGKLPDGNMHVVMMDVGQGDSILVRTPGYQNILVDGGPGSAVLERLGDQLPFFDRDIDLVVLTHPDSDHMAGLAKVVERYNIKNVLMTGVMRDMPRYVSFLNAVKISGARVIFARGDRDLDLGNGVVLDVLWPGGGVIGHETKHPNNESIALKISWGNRSVLLTGDIEERTEMSILSQPLDISADSLQVPHHGSKTSSSTGFILAVDPKYAFVSVGENNKYGHPAGDIMARYGHFGIPVRSTAKEGNMDMVLY